MTDDRAKPTSPASAPPAYPKASAWAEERGVRLSIEFQGGLIVCRIEETLDGLNFKEIAKASITHWRWSDLLSITGFQPKPPKPGSSTVVPTR